MSHDEKFPPLGRRSDEELLKFLQENLGAEDLINDFIWQSDDQILMPGSSMKIGDGGGFANSVFRTAGDLVFDFANGTGDNGLDTGAEANNSYYALYAIPDGAAAYKLVASNVSPEVGGPVGSTQYRYLGLFRNGGNNGVSDDRIPQFIKSGDIFQMHKHVSISTAAGVNLISSVSAGVLQYDRVVAMSGQAVPFNRFWALVYANTSANSSDIQLYPGNGATIHHRPVQFRGGNNDGEMNAWMASTPQTPRITMTSSVVAPINILLNGWKDPILAARANR